MQQPGIGESASGAQSTAEQDAGATLAAEEHAHQVVGRDESASHRDLNAEARDDAADRRDNDSAKIERKMASRSTPLRTALTHAAEVRAQAARDRRRAAHDRAEAAADRKWMAAEHESVLEELRRAHRDELTGAYRRGAGEEVLQDEIDRARRGDGRLVLAFIDVDGLREINNREGHLAGDTLLRQVVSAIAQKIRSFEPIVRFGGDEFVCAVGGVGLEQAAERFGEVQDTLAETAGGAAVSVGFAELREDDTLDDLVERADAALLEIRRARSTGTA